MHRLDIVIVTPALAEANNGNWQTAHRWARMLSPAYRVGLATSWSAGDETLMIALHARRSAASIERWRAAHPSAPLILVLTGTDLYRDILDDAASQSSLRTADRLIVLNEVGAHSLPADLRPRVRIVLQSCPARRPLDKSERHLRALMVGHLRDVKSPSTYFDAARRLAHRTDVLLDHVGEALDVALGAEAAELATTCPAYRWLGSLPHDATRRRIQSAHVLVHPSRMEGGAHVVIEAVRSGTPVLASRIDGNVGLLGDAYDGYFPVGDGAALATLLERLRDDSGLLTHLQHQSAERAPMFDGSRESCAMHALIVELLGSAGAM